MGISVFLSYSLSPSSRQARFVARMVEDLEERGLEPRTLGVTDYDSDNPLRAIRRVLVESNGLLTIAFRRVEIHAGTLRYLDARGDVCERDVGGTWTTNPYCHVEAAMAFELGLPVLVLREDGVHEEGVLSAGVFGPRLPPFRLDAALNEHFRSTSWSQGAATWEHHVRTVVEKKGTPSSLF